MSSTDATETDWTSKTLLGSVGLVVVIVLLAGWLLWPSGERSAETPRPSVEAAPTTAMSPAPPERSARAGGCPDQPTDSTVPERGPKAEWELYRGIAMPRSSEHGPAVEDGEIARCYSHTPTGVLIASIQFTARSLLGNNTRAIVEALAVDSAGREKYIVSSEVRPERTGEADPDEVCQVAGFRFVDYSPDRAIVAFAFRCAPGLYQISEVRLDWTDDDWRVALDPTGLVSPSTSSQPNLRGFTEWAGI